VKRLVGEKHSVRCAQSSVAILTDTSFGLAAEERPRAGGSRDAIALLTADHREIEAAFIQYERDEAEAGSTGLTTSTLTSLKIHMEVEEEIFYAAFLAATHDSKTHHDAMVEHEVIKKLVEDIENSDPGDDYYGSMVRILWRTLKGHLDREEAPGGMLAPLKSSSMNLLALGDEISIRREILGELMATRK
jgi:hypothetical protein